MRQYTINTHTKNLG